MVTPAYFISFIAQAVRSFGLWAPKRYLEFFYRIRSNKNTRIAYYHAIGQFLDWCQCAGFRDLENIQPITVAAYVEQHLGSPAMCIIAKVTVILEIFLRDSLGDILRSRCHRPIQRATTGWTKHASYFPLGGPEIACASHRILFDTEVEKAWVGRAFIISLSLRMSPRTWPILFEMSALRLGGC